MKLPSKNAETGEREGLRAREALGLTTTQPLDDILRGVERNTPLNVFVRPLGQDGIAGAFWTSRDVPFVVVNSSYAPVRQRFTLAHELGHWHLGHGNTYDETLAWSDGRPKEVQANFFAASFLMPAPAVSSALSRMAVKDIAFDTLIMLAAEFGVSAMAMRIRLETLEVISKQQIKEFDGLIDAQAHYGLLKHLGAQPMEDTLAAATAEGSRMPPLMSAKVLRGVEQKLIAEDQAARILRLEPERLHALREKLAVVAE